MKHLENVFYAKKSLLEKVKHQQLIIYKMNKTTVMLETKIFAFPVKDVFHII